MARGFKLPLDFGGGERLERPTGRPKLGGGWAAPDEILPPASPAQRALRERGHIKRRRGKR